MERKEVKSTYKWDTDILFKSVDEWDNLYKQAEGDLDFSLFRGKLGDKKVLLDCLKKQEQVSAKIEKLYLYSHMKKDEDTRVAQYDSLYSRANGLFVKFSAETSFVVPELTALDEAVLKGLAADKDLIDYDYMLEEIIKSKPHVLSEKEENLLALGGGVFSSFKNIFGMIDNADLPLPEIDDGKGGVIKLSHGIYGMILHGGDRALRARAFKAYYQTYIGLINTISATYYGNVKKDVYLAKARKYDSCLQKALFSEDVPVVVYENLLSSIQNALPAMHRYIASRKSALDLDEMHMYDIYAPIVEDAELKLSYDDAYSLVKEGLKPLGTEYISLLDKGFNEGWIDVEETDGKRSGAYSTGIYGYHPYVLLNYRPTTHDVFTIAHEMGHALHTYYSNQSQPYSKADYRIFVAEVASTVNEVLLLKHILNKEKDVKLKKYLLSYFLDMIRTTMFRQTMFAEFEYTAHDMVEKDIPLTHENMNEAYLALNKKYYGDGVVSDEEIAYEWARIPHFYSSFYVYKYATGLISAITIAENILTQGDQAVKKYKAFLSSGGSRGPVELLKLAGVDLTTKEPFENAMRVFEDTLNKFNAL